MALERAHGLRSCRLRGVSPVPGRVDRGELDLAVPEPPQRGPLGTRRLGREPDDRLPNRGRFGHGGERVAGQLEASVDGRDGLRRLGRAGGGQYEPDMARGQERELPLCRGERRAGEAHETARATRSPVAVSSTRATATSVPSSRRAASMSPLSCTSRLAPSATAATVCASRCTTAAEIASATPEPASTLLGLAAAARTRRL